MNNLLSYCGLAESRMRASDTDLPVTVTALVYKPRILGLKNEEFPFLVHKWSVI